ncbi:TauD/TfdA family dioxygenase [Streptomyces telluris]|uniref:TauD/TfdA family dioxygenase n=1 Tax=Streptomyces telluris TaxID=2720021 RepID=A0A9X2RMN4_9ACTN|nr:TauD/TfdA family dioxygenase [Streptomyces telluris]MCQ8770954.1 TauD/TfdA family dioxygenase [Streptomyces telluris]NJP75765.1 TauD/TfdA family dioxygenase [Streptomyces telluris]
MFAATIAPFGTGQGRLITAEDGAALSELRPREVVAELAEAGFLLLRGFAPSLEDFSLFVKHHSDRVTLDPARSFHGGDVAQKVDVGYDSVGLHTENGNSPFAPDLTWFLSEKAASSGSQTTVCDGYRVWDAFGERTRAAYLAQDVLYSRRVEEARWKGFVSHHSGGTKAPEDITVDDMRALAQGQGRTVIELLDDGAIRYDFHIPAAHPTLFGDRLAFANSILGPSNNYEPPRITFADGTPFDAELVEETERVTAEMTEEIVWQDGDVALVDNTRVMHGRRPIEDPERTIYNAQSYLAAELRSR